MVLVRKRAIIITNTVQYFRVGIFSLFALSTVVIVSLHMSNWIYHPSYRDIKSEDCDSTSQRKRSFKFKTETHTVEGSALRKIPKLSELKSFRNTLNKVITIVEKHEESSGYYKSSRKPIPKQVISTKTLNKKVTFRSRERPDLKFLKTLNFSGPVYYNGTFVRRPLLKRRIGSSIPAVLLNITKLKPSSEIPVHSLAQEEPYISRMQDIQEACRKYPDGKFTNTIDLQRLIYDDFHKTIMCVVPKAACTTWKSMMFYLMGRISKENAFTIDKNYLVLNFGKLKTMAGLSRQGILERMNKYTKFMVTRHPYRRLVSAYKSKFGNAKASSYTYSHGRKIARMAMSKYLNGFAPKYARQPKLLVMSTLTSHPEFKKLTDTDKAKVIDIALRGFSGNITFKEFLRYGVVAEAGNPRAMDIHWRPQHMLCNPCAINYDFVVRFDHLEHESKLLLSFIQKDDPPERWIKFPEGHPASVDNIVTQKTFNAISPEMREVTKHIYQNDFKYFNYDANIL